MVMIVNYLALPENTMENFWQFCGNRTYGLSIAGYENRKRAILKTFNASINDDGNYVFETEEDYTFFILRWS
jgi:hypothetical protein